MERNESDVNALQEMIAAQNASGAVLPENPDNWRYSWNTEGRLTSLNLNGCNLSGALSLKGLNALKYVNCSQNHIETLDVSDNPKLIHLDCEQNDLKVLDLHAQQKLRDLWCNNNRLSRLETNGCQELEHLRCRGNVLQALNISGNPRLGVLDCRGNTLLEVLDITENKKLNHLRCDPLTRIEEDLSKEEIEL